jgi:hypothetical protein
MTARGHDNFLPWLFFVGVVTPSQIGGQRKACHGGSDQPTSEVRSPHYGMIRGGIYQHPRRAVARHGSGRKL